MRLAGGEDMDEFVVSGRPRISDMDTQRHVTSRAYESLCYDARFLLLEKSGFPVEKLLEEKILLQPLRSEAKFYQQQMAGADLSVVTKAVRVKDGLIFWDQEVRQKDGKSAAHIKTLTRLEKGGAGFNVTAIGEGLDSPMFDEMAPYGGSCKRTVCSLTVGCSDRDILGVPYVSSLWKVFEEGRWRFSQDRDLTLDLFVKIDTIVFFMGGRIDVIRLPLPGEELKVHTWIRNLGGIRFNFCQEALDSSGKAVMRMEDDQIVVSVSRARPRKPPLEFIEILKDYIEN